MTPVAFAGTAIGANDFFGIIIAVGMAAYLSRSARPTATCPAAAGAASTWPPPSRAQAATGPTTAPPARPKVSSTAQHETRSIPVPPTLVRAHLKRYGTIPAGRVFRTACGGPIQDSAYSAVWQAARAAALTPAQHASRSLAAPTTCGTPPSPCG